MRRLAILGAVAALAAACGGGGEQAVPEGVTTAAGFEFASAPFDPGESIPARFTCDGENLSPTLSWTGVPQGTAELAIVVEDPDAPGGIFIHWLVYGLPPDSTGVPEQVPAEPEVAGPPPLRQGENDFGDVGWSGPCPPEGESHRYVFRLLALAAELGLAAGTGPGDFQAAAEGQVIAEARLEGVYERP